MEDREELHRELRRQSRRLVDASRELVERAKGDIETAHARLERARNVLQASWLYRALQQGPGGRAVNLLTDLDALQGQHGRRVDEVDGRRRSA